MRGYFSFFQKMISTGFDEDQKCEEYDGKFIVDTEDDTAFFNMNLGGTFGNKSNLNTNKTETYGGFSMNWPQSNFKTNQPTATPTKNTTDPSKCDNNCASCMWSAFCKSATKGLTALASGGSFIPKLG